MQKQRKENIKEKNAGKSLCGIFIEEMMMFKGPFKSKDNDGKIYNLKLEKTSNKRENIIEFLDKKKIYIMGFDQFTC